MRLSAHALALALAPAFPVTQASAQEPQPVVEEGDAVPGVGNVTSISTLAVNDSGTTRIEVDTDNADTDVDNALLTDGALTLREGQALPAPMGALLDSFDSININASGDSGYNFFLDLPSDDSGVYFNTTLVIQEGSISAAPQFSAGTPYIGFFDVKMNDTNQMIVMASVDDPNIASSVDRGLMRIDLDAAGGILSEDVFLKEGDVIPGAAGELITDFGTGPHETAFNNLGEILFGVDLTGGSSTNAVYLDSTPLALQGMPSPVAGRNWSSLSTVELDLNDSGDHVYSGSLDGDSATNLLIVRNGVKFRQEGDTLPAIGGVSVFTSFGSGPLYLSEAGEVLWYGDWNDPDTDIDTGLFIDDELIVQEGVTTVGGVVIDTLRGITDGYIMSPDGRFVLFEAILADGTEGAYMIDRSGSGTNYCVATQNSTGGAATISISGSLSIADMNLSLVGSALPANVPCLFFYGPNQIQVPFGDGFRCVGGTTHRVQPLSSADGGGTVTRSVDFGAPYAAPIIPGSVFNFQGWYRDNMAGMSGFNLTDGIELPFQ